MAALQLPVVLTKLSYLIDNPWAVSLDRATMAGLILADSLMDRNLGTRPVTLVGYSLGSRVIFSCLQELSRKGAYGLVQNVFIFGSPIVVKQDEYLRARSVVSGRFVNGFNRNDWILGYLFRLTNGGIRRVAGLAAISDVPRIENMDVTEWVVGHMDYRTAMPRLLRECGWAVESDEFTEIEDPDPENHKERQRELINEIEEARKELEKEAREKEAAAAVAGKKSGSGKSRFSFFGKRKNAKRAEWEVYEESSYAKGGAPANGENGEKLEDRLDSNRGVLFDVDAIRAELAKENPQMQVKELPSTLPVMKLDLSSPPNSPPARSKLSGSDSPSTLQPRQSLGKASATDTASALQRSSHDSNGSRDDGRPQARAPSSGGYNSDYYPPTYSHTRTISRGSYFEAPLPQQGGGFRTGPVGAGDEIQMTFDTSFDDSPLPAPRNLDEIHNKKTRSETALGAEEDEVEGTGQQRPAFRSASTVPNVVLADPWADDDDEFKEKEVTMTFA